MVEHVESVLENEQRTVALLQILVSKLQGFQWPAADAEIKSLALLHDVYHGLKGFFERCVRIVAVAVEEVNILEIHSLETLIQTGHQILTGTPVAVRTFPHIITCFG